MNNHALSLTATPIIIDPDMNREDIRREWESMMIRSQASADFIEGKISVDDYLDTIAEEGDYADQILQAWEYGDLLMELGG